MRALHLLTRRGTRIWKNIPPCSQAALPAPVRSATRPPRKPYSTDHNPAPWIKHSLSSIIKSNSDLTTFVPPSRSHTAYIALGSNLGKRVGEIEKACNLMESKGIKIKRTSSLWETEPMYVLDQDKFVNGVCEVETTLGPVDLLYELQDIETSLGRKKVIDKGPRNIDLDILLYDDEVIDLERLKIPHPGILEREFVLRPLAELIPGKALDPTSPWKVTQDYLNALPSSPPISTITPLDDPWREHSMEPIRALQPTRKTHVMAIINQTPDSFSNPPNHKVDSSKTNELLLRNILDGSTILDIGGMSTAPGAPTVSAQIETARVTSLIKSLHQQRESPPEHPERTVLDGSNPISSPPSIPRFAISIDTYRASVAEAAVKAGADIINDISAGQLDPEMLPYMARSGKTVVLMHMRGTPQTMSTLTDYPDGLIPMIARDLLARVAEAEAAGIRRWRIILDPGIGFAKTGTQNIEILRRLDELRDWPGLRGLPWLVGTSNKRFIGKITGERLEGKQQRAWGTAATVAAAVVGGADIVRCHAVGPMVKVARMSDAIWRGRTAGFKGASSIGEGD